VGHYKPNLNDIIPKVKVSNVKFPKMCKKIPKIRKNPKNNIAGEVVVLMIREKER